jgi:predicted MPP superfamily phosphohydrolase
MRKSIPFLLLLVLAWTVLWAQPADIQFIFTSDLHYGISRPEFRGSVNVDSRVVNAALVAQINRLSETVFPADGGYRADQPVGTFDFVAIGGDITNRAEMTHGAGAIQSAAVSWSQFRSGYIDGLKLRDRLGGRTPLYVVPGNHDVSNAIGYYKPMRQIDKTAMTETYNLMMRPVTPKTPATLDYPHDKVLVSHDIGGFHFLFITLWPDSSMRKGMENDLKSVNPNTPVIVFAHDPPDSDSKHFINPNGKHDINPADQFENLLSDTFADSNEGEHGAAALPPPIRAWEAFLKQHPNITAYFHGHSNWNQFYVWSGPDHTVTLHTFRADSPMKGRFSMLEEKKLSFQIATIDIASRTMTVREVLWNANPQAPNSPISWGASTTVRLAPRSIPQRTNSLP